MGGRLSWAAALWALWPCSSSAAGRPQVAVVKSESLALYARLVAGFSAESRSEVVEYDLKGSHERGEKVFASLKENPPALVLAVGPIAANAARRLLSDVPVVFTMVPNYEKFGLEARNVTGIALSPPSKFQLQTLKTVIPKVTRVGAVFNPAYSEAVVAQAAADAESLGLTLSRAKAETPEEVGRALKQLAGKIDALWMIADRTATHAVSVRAMIEFAQDKKIPLLALSEGQVQDGALLSLSPNLAAIGQQAGRLANRIVYEKIDPGAVAVQQPEGIDMAVNLSTARKLGSECAVAVDLLRFASRNGYAVKVFE